MHNYELTIVISPEMVELDAQKLEAKIHNSITKKGGSIVNNNFWGKHELAYRLGKHEFAYFATAVFNLSGEAISELVSEIRLMPEILRHLVISLDKEKIKLEDLKKMELTREQPVVSVPTRRAAAKPAAKTVSRPAVKPAAPKKDEATRMKELDEKLEDILTDKDEN